MNDPKNHRGGLAVESGLMTDDGEELSRAELIARIIDPVSFEKVRQGGQLDDAQWRCNRARDKAAHIATLFDTRAPSDAALVEALKDVTAHLAAAISLLSRSPKTGAASNKMFDQMLIDYDNSAARGRAALAAAKGQP